MMLAPLGRCCRVYATAARCQAGAKAAGFETAASPHPPSTAEKLNSAGYGPAASPAEKRLALAKLALKDTRRWVPPLGKMSQFIDDIFAFKESREVHGPRSPGRPRGGSTPVGEMTAAAFQHAWGISANVLHGIRQFDTKADVQAYFDAVAAVDEAPGSLYDDPEMYELAFGGRDMAAEVDFLDAVSRTHGTGPMASFLELGAGPAAHAIAAARRGIAATALDCSPAMRRHGLARAESAGVALTYLLGDMASFEFGPGVQVDVAALLLGTVQHLLTADAAVGCFGRAAASLAPGGLLIVELPDPECLFSGEEFAPASFSPPLTPDGRGVAVKWNARGDHFDSLTQVLRRTVAFTATAGGKKRRLREVCPQRLFTATEIELLGRTAGLRVAAMFPELSAAARPLVPGGAPNKSNRLVVVLKRA